MSKLSESKLKKCLRAASKESLEEIICALYTGNELSKQYLNMRFNAEEYATELVDTYQKKIDRCFPLNCSSDCKIVEAHRAVKELVKLHVSPEITLDIMLYFVESGNEYTQTFGDIDERFYDTLLTVYDQFVEMLNAQVNDSIYTRLKGRIDELVKGSQGIGWGYSDGIAVISGGILGKADE